jgi:uncharacterized protein involved in exopolysaccharide biosynthesis
MQTRSVHLLESRGSQSVLLRDTLERLFRQKTLILALAAGWTVLMAAYLVFWPASFEEEIRFVINNTRAGAVVSPEYNNGPVSRDYVDESVIATEIQLLSDEDLLRGVVEKCGLAPQSDNAHIEKAVEELRKSLKVAPVLKANMIKASYSSSSPQEVEDVLRAVADGYLETHLRVHASHGAYELFEKQAEVYQKRLKDLQNRQAAFQEPRNIVALGQQKDLNLKKLLDVQATGRENEAAWAANNKRLARLREQLAGLDKRITTQARKVPNQYSVERLNTMLVELQNRRTDLLAKFQPQDRTVQEVEKQIADTKAALGHADTMSSTEETTDVNPLRQSLEAELAKAEVADAEFRSRAAFLNRDVHDYQASLSNLQHASNDDDQLLREIKETEENLNLYSKKREEARIEEAMNQQKIANVALIQPAHLPVLPKSKLSVTFLASYALGLFLVAGLAFAAGLIRPYVYTAWELEELSGAPVLASVSNQPGLRSAPQLLSASVPELTQ